MTSIHNLIAAIKPGLYCKKELIRKVKRKASAEGYLAAAEIAEPRSSEPFVFDMDSAKENPFLKVGLKFPKEEHKITYDSPASSLEPTYFWMIDSLSEDLKDVEKITDNFVSSPGSAHFSELGMKATKMQEEAMKALGAVNQVVKSILNIIYDLKEFKTRLALYDGLNSKDPKKKEAAMLSLKQIWMDTVDTKRGRTAIKLMAQEFQYVTIIDAFMAAGSLKSLEKLDLNDRVKRILKQRVSEFEQWLKESEAELRKRYNIEKNYLKSQANTVRIYSRWMKPYLNFARRLEQNAEEKADIVSTFNSVIMELSVLGKKEYDPEDDVIKGLLPKIFKLPFRRKYYSVVISELRFRGMPQKAQHGGYAFGGKTEIKITSYGLNNDELDVLKKELEKDDINEMARLIEGAASDSLKEMQKDIDEFLEDKGPEKKEQQSEDINPFSALFSFAKPRRKDKTGNSPEPVSEKIKVRPDGPYEKILRSQAIIKARETSSKLFDKYKQLNEMAV